MGPLALEERKPESWDHLAEFDGPGGTAGEPSEELVASPLLTGRPDYPGLTAPHHQWTQPALLLSRLARMAARLLQGPLLAFPRLDAILAAGQTTASGKTAHSSRSNAIRLDLRASRAASMDLSVGGTLLLASCA